MNKISLALIVAAPLALGGIAIAQPSATPSTTPTPNVQTSTPGAGCTATGNAMRSGNLGGGPSSTACAPQTSANTAAVAPAAAAPAATAPATASTTSRNSTSTAGSTDTRSSGAMANSEPTQVARAPRADRN